MGKEGDECTISKEYIRTYCPNIHTVVLGHKGSKKTILGGRGKSLLQKVFYVIHWLNIPYLVIALGHGIAKEIMNHSQQHIKNLLQSILT